MSSSAVLEERNTSSGSAFPNERGLQFGRRTPSLKPGLGGGAVAISQTIWKGEMTDEAEALVVVGWAMASYYRFV